MVAVTGCESNNKDGKDLKTTEGDLERDEINAYDTREEFFTSNEWIEFEKDANIKIAENEARIAELRLKMSKSGKTFDKLYEKNIDRLEEENRTLRNRLEAYRKSESGWENFKEEFDRDMQNLGEALEDLTIDNEK